MGLEQSPDRHLGQSMPGPAQWRSDHDVR
jgi:hypothetical protein